MTPTRRKPFRYDLAALALLFIYPLLVYPERGLFRLTSVSFGQQLTLMFIFGIAALGLNVVVGYTGLLHLGIAAFFGIGAYVTGILTVPANPFQVSFSAALVISTLVAGLFGVLLGAPTLRLRGDYLAIVTLGFGEVTRYTLQNLEHIAAGTRGLNPIPPPMAPKWLAQLGVDTDWSRNYWLFYYLALGILTLVIVLLLNLERSRLGRAWVAIREDELAATCMGINAAHAKLSALALGAALAGLAGSLYATTLTSTAAPSAYDFNRSIILLCCVILGGLGSVRGTLLGVLLLVGLDSVVAPMIDSLAQRINPNGIAILSFSSWRLMIFGLALILMMRFRPEGLLPSIRVRQELTGDAPLPGLPGSAVR